MLSSPYNKQSRHEIPGSRVNKSLHWSHFPGPSPVFPFPCSLEALHSPWDQSRTWAVGSLLCSSLCKSPTASGASPCPTSSQTGRAEPSTSSSHPALAFTPLLPCPSPSPNGGLTFNWPDDREVGRASSCFGWLCSIKLTRVLVNRVATIHWLCSSVMCCLWGWVLYRVWVDCIIETVGVISSSSGLLDSLCIDWISGDQGIVPGWSHHFSPPASMLPRNCSELPLPVSLALTALTLRRTFCTILKNMFYFP